jgi:peptide deformylase
MEKDWEGCLTVPGLRGLVPRHRRIEVRYLIRDGRPVETGCDGFIARVFQHELDHLDGKVFLDRIEDPVEIMMEREWQRMIADR